MIEFREVSKAYGTNVIFSNVSFTIEDGEFVVFSGKSGSGKTTMLNLIGAVDKVTAGSIIVDGKDITKMRNRTEYFRSKVGFLFQNFALSDNKTVKQNLEMTVRSSRTDIPIDSALDSVGLLPKKNEKVYTLSGGEQQRTALARLLIKKCDIVLADEPTGSLDKENANEVMQILLEMNRSGKTVILVTHDEELRQMGSRIIEL